ncbi:MAG: VWA domain-containing protein [Terracidiphilus sp.]
MKRFAWILVVLLLASLAWAAKRVTVDQLEQILNASQGKPDAEVAWHLSDLELTERLSSTRLARLKASIPDEKVQAALVVLADASEFRDPPAAEIPATAPPDLAAQRRMLALTVSYVGKTIPLLPNFLATRVTSRFEDTPLLQRPGSFIPFEPLHSVGNSSVTVSYRQGHEAVDTGAAKEKQTQGLTTWGVFGPILGTVLEDAARSKLAWSHWEQGASGPMAVYSYSVPKEKSHYRVDYCCVAEQDSTSVANLHPFSQIVAYHGEIAVDPASGTILRLMLEAEMKASDPVAKASIMVEYGPVEIGGKTYFCPVKSVSSTLAQSLQFNDRYLFPEANELQPLKTMLNDVAFEQYHLFRTEARVVAGDAELASGTPPPDAAQAKPTNPENPPSEAAKPAEAAAQSASPASPVAGAAPSAPPVAGTATEPAAPSTPAPEQEIAETEAGGVPNTPANPGMPQPSGFTLKVASRLVDIGVVAYDKKGHPVKDLKSEDFEIYDNGRRQNLRYFSQAAPAPAALPDQPVASSGQPTGAQPQPAFSNHGSGSSDAIAPAEKSESSVTILLLDGSNLAFGDLTNARGQALQFLRALPAGERVGLYAMKRTGFQILAEETTDHARLEDKLSRWMPSAQDLQNAQDEEQRNRQQFDVVHSVEDLLYVNGNTSNDPEGHTQTLDPALRDWGSNPGRDAMMILESVAWHLAAIPGHKNLVWISSDNALVDWSNNAVSIEKGDKHIEPNTLRAQEAMNDAHVSVYPLDASQLEGGMVDASVYNKNVELAPTVNLQLQNLGPEASSGADIDSQDYGGHDLRPGRLRAQMQQDMRPIQGPIRHLADATGGRIFRRSGSISNELNGVVDDGHASYQLSFYPEGQADGQFHNLTVKLTGNQKGVVLRYRTGYLYTKEPATLKERFRQAVWQPVDANQVAVTAQPIAFEGGLRVKITVAAGDLALEEKSGHWSGNLDVFLVQRDDAGLQAQLEGKRLGLQLKDSTLQYLLKNGLSVERTVHLKPSITSLRILLVDENSGRMGSVTIPASALQAGH